MTRTPDSLSAAELLAIPADAPERLFPRDAEEIKKTYRKLAQLWHPDRCKDPRATDVFNHVKQLRESGERKLADGNWEVPNLFEFTTTEGRSFQLHYGVKAPFELGTMYISPRHVAYVVDKQYADLFQAGLTTLRGLRFANPTMEKEMRRNLPVIKAVHETATAHILILEKAPELVRLRDVLEHSGGKIEPKHLGWVLSHLYNTACYLRWAGLTHNDLSLDSVFISPEHHGGAVLGGWWYAAAANSPLRALPTRSMELAPSDVLRRKKADARVDLELIRAIGRELLGDPPGTGLSWNKEVPKALANWLRAPTSGDALTDYKSWRDHVLPGSFGPRRFVKWDINLSNHYQPRRM
jgi:hypothetical protein